MEADKTFDVTVVGGGIVGAATAYTLQAQFPSLRTLLLEKENALASHQSGHNSGVIHSGIYYNPGSLRAKNCVAGRNLLVQFAKEHHIKHDICGKVIVATRDDELPTLDRIFKNGLQNDVEGIAKIGPDQIRKHEPFVEGISGIWVPCAGIIDYKAVTERLAEQVIKTQSASRIALGETVLSMKREGAGMRVLTSKGHYKTRYIIFCGGLFSDRLAEKHGLQLQEQIISFRGDYYELTAEARKKVNNLIYPVPNPKFPFLGVHFTRMISGDIECGPSAVLSFKREGYGKTDFSFRDAAEALSYSGTWRLLFNNFGFAMGEYHRAFSRKAFLRQLQRLIPSLTAQDIKPARSGVRAMLMAQDGSLVDDFRVIYHDKAIHVLNAPSPAATACLSIAKEISAKASVHFHL